MKNQRRKLRISHIYECYCREECFYGMNVAGKTLCDQEHCIKEQEQKQKRLDEIYVKLHRFSPKQKELTELEKRIWK